MPGVYLQLLAFVAVGLAGAGAASWAAWRSWDRAYRRGYAEGHRAGVRHAWNAQDALADDVIRLVPHLDPRQPPPGA